MPLHLQKLSVGSVSIDTLREWQTGLAARRGREGRAALPDHVTRMTPRRGAEILDGGSIYWVIKGVMQCRNRIIDLEETRTADGRKACRIVLDPQLVAVEPAARRAFQGWRYLAVDDAPKDLSLSGGDTLPAHLRTRLVEIGAW